MNREDFPIIDDKLIYLDNGATTLKPKVVVEEINDYYLKHSVNIHRGDYDLAKKVDDLYDDARKTVKEFIGAHRSEEIIFTKGTTNSLNMVVFGYMKKHLKSGDEVLITKAEHASNILPWLELVKSNNIVLKYMDLDEEYCLLTESVEKSISSRTKVISIAALTNVIGDVRDIEAIGKICRDNNILFVVDGAQSVPHMKTDVVRDNIDFLAFSSHKMLGPTGVGVLYGRYELLYEMDPIEFGGGMSAFFEADGSNEFRDIPNCFEAGTPPIAQVLGLKKAIDYLNDIGMDKVYEHELELKRYFIDQTKDIDNLVIYNKNTKSGIITFNIKDVFSQDSAIFLNHFGICVRAGNHCAKILKDEINTRNTCRLSFYLYNTKEEVDKVVGVLKRSRDIFNIIL